MILGIGIDILHLPRIVSLVVKLASTIPIPPRSFGNVLKSAHEEKNQSTIALGFHKVARRILSAEELTEWERRTIDDISWRAVLGLEVEEYRRKTAADRQGTYTGPLQYLSTRWTAKEAAHKAISPHAILTWKDCRVSYLPPPSHLPLLSTKPVLLPTRTIVPEPGHLDRLPVTLPKKCCLDHRPVTISEAHLTVSHDGDYAISQILFEGSIGEP